MPPRRTTARTGGAHSRSISLVDENAPVHSLVGPQRSKPITSTSTLVSKSHRVNPSTSSNFHTISTTTDVATVHISHQHSSSLGGGGVTLNHIANRKVLGDVSNATKAIGPSKANLDNKSNPKTNKVRKVSSQASLLPTHPSSVSSHKALQSGTSATYGGNAGKKLAATLKTRSSAQNLNSFHHHVSVNNNHKRKPIQKSISASGVGHSSWADVLPKQETEEFEILADEAEEEAGVAEEMDTEEEQVKVEHLAAGQEIMSPQGEGEKMQDKDRIPSTGHVEDMVIDEERPIGTIMETNISIEGVLQKPVAIFLDSHIPEQDHELVRSPELIKMESDENELSLCPNNVEDHFNDSQDSGNWLLLSSEEEEDCRVLIDSIKRDFQEELDFWDTTMVAEYSEDIFKYMEELEESTLPNPRYMDSQTEIEWDMRTTLIDWLLQVHMRYHMLPETLWIAVNIIDRFLSKRVVSLVKFQLVGVTAMFVAAKYEEIMAPSVEEFVYMTENGYTREEILKGEKILLTTLDFRISPYCSPYSWLRRISKADDYDIQTRTLSKFLMELTLLDHRFLRAKSSMIAAIGMYTARKMLGGDWGDAFVFYSGYTEAQLITPMTFLIETLSTEGFEERFVYKKYANRKFLKASIFARNQALKKIKEEESCNEN